MDKNKRSHAPYCGRILCPCCRLFTLKSYNDYEICEICFWEDDGAINSGDFSGPNTFASLWIVKRSPSTQNQVEVD